MLISSHDVSKADVTLLIPCLNEDAAISDLILSLRKFDSLCKLMIIDNGSTDNTLSIAQSLGVNVLQEDRLGKGNALRTGLAHVTTTYVIFLDGDNTLDIDIIPDMIRLLIEGFDMVVANRTTTHRNTFRRFHRIGNLLFVALHRYFVKTQIKDVLCGFRGIRTDLAKGMNLRSEGFEIEIEINVRASRMKYTITNLDCIYSTRNNSFSKLRTLRDGLRLFVYFFRILNDSRKW